MFTDSHLSRCHPSPAEFGWNMWLFIWKIFNFCIREVFFSTSTLSFKQKKTFLYLKIFCRYEKITKKWRKILWRKLQVIFHTHLKALMRRKNDSREESNTRGKLDDFIINQKSKAKKFREIYERFEWRKLCEEFALMIHKKVFFIGFIRLRWKLKDWWRRRSKEFEKERMGRLSIKNR